jgi:hypothetical protein
MKTVFGQTKAMQHIRCGPYTRYRTAQIESEYQSIICDTLAGGAVRMLVRAFPGRYSVCAHKTCVRENQVKVEIYRDPYGPLHEDGSSAGTRMRHYRAPHYTAPIWGAFL